jgi:hypothetical protein
MIYPAWLGTNKVYPDWIGLWTAPVLPDLVPGDIVYLIEEQRLIPFAHELKMKLMVLERLPISLSEELCMMLLQVEPRLENHLPEPRLTWLAAESRVVRFTGNVPPGQPDYLYLADENLNILRDENGMDLTP